MSTRQKQYLVDDMLRIHANTLLAPYADLVLATYLTPNIAQADIQLNIAENAVHFIPLRRPCLNLIILLELRQKHVEALQQLKQLLQISQGDLQNDIQQLPPEHVQLLNTLLAEVRQNKTAP